MDDDRSYNSNWSGSAQSVSGGFGTRGTSFRSFGSNLSTASDGELSLKRDREREGRCSECGVQTYEVRTDPQNGQTRKVPLTVENEVHRGRCLFCHPIRTYQGQHNQSPDGSFPSSRSVVTVSSTNSHTGSLTRPDHVSSNVSLGNGSLTVSTFDNPAVEDALQILDNEGCDLLEILSTMRRHPTERRIQEKGCEKLWIQSWEDENSAAIGRVGGIPILLLAMSTHPASQALQQSGCEALRNLALNDYNRDSIKENGGINIIVQAMIKHPDAIGVQQCGCTALGNLAACSDFHLEIANAGGLHAIMNAAQQNQEEECILRAAYQALRAMGYDPNREGREQ
eukprot:CAMPEP_0194200500 /NCGR_PEP_ID=MMETSP0156-20130528/1075_1 /TAXON_ID=33649 /ORGANISM="Thalassionema nitzschioides, Strain L26-B" /LENGTH=339 /DNA_ID=CAMNT_0038925505 /DNA_START=205 /DNA_END=1224 /DNA_ORIENTATION=+